MKNQTMSYNACYALNIAVPLCFNSVKHHLCFTSVASKDGVAFLKYSFYEYKCLYWYSISFFDGHIVNSLFFCGLACCVRDFRCFCYSLDLVIDDSLGLSKFVSQYGRSV